MSIGTPALPPLERRYTLGREPGPLRQIIAGLTRGLTQTASRSPNVGTSSPAIPPLPCCAGHPRRLPGPHRAGGLTGRVVDALGRTRSLPNAQ